MDGPDATAFAQAQFANDVVALPPGNWQWNGYEWTWTAGHYEPDPNASGYYSNSYDSQYYSENPNYDASFEAGVYYNNQY